MATVFFLMMSELPTYPDASSAFPLEHLWKCCAKGVLICSHLRICPHFWLHDSFKQRGSDPSFLALAASAHALAIDVEGQLYTWGRNEV